MTQIHNRVVVFGDDSSSIASFATAKWGILWEENWDLKWGTHHDWDKNLIPPYSTAYPLVN